MWRREDAIAPELQPCIEIRALDANDFGIMKATGGRFAEQVQLYYEKRGITSAYGVFVSATLAHVSWVYTAAEYACEPTEQLRLGARDAEITNCFTLEDFRRLGLYTNATRFISSLLFSRNIDCVYMKTDPEGAASQRAILKAGLKRCGTVRHLWVPFLPGWKGWYRWTSIELT